MGIGPSTTPEKTRADSTRDGEKPSSGMGHPLPLNVISSPTASIEVAVRRHLLRYLILPKSHGIKRDEETDYYGRETEEKEKKLIPVVFRWEHGGKNVWRIPLNKSEKDFTLIANLPPGPYEYKFIVDGKWRYAPDLPTITDRDGNVNNTMEVKELPRTQDQKLGGSPPGNYTQEITAEDFSKEPPVLPPHLERAFLNITPTSEDSSVLPLPHHVVINHVYSRRQDDLLILGATHRYDKNFITTVFYKPNIPDEHP